MAAKASARALKTSYHHGDLRRTLLDGALYIVEREGLGVLSLRELARRVGVSHAAPYRHFASREALLVALAIEGFVGLEAQMHAELATLAAGADAPTRLRAIGRAYVGYATSHPGHFRVMFSSELRDGADPALAAAAEPGLAMLVDTLAAGQAELAFVEGDPRQLAVSAWSLVHGLSLLLIDRQLDPLLDVAPDAAMLAEQVVTTTIRGLSPPGGTVDASSRRTADRCHVAAPAKSGAGSAKRADSGRRDAGAKSRRER